jgi:hypothetical protein
MTDAQLNKLKYPIGPFALRDVFTREDLDSFTSTIASAPAQYRSAIRNLSASDLRKTYRDGSWDVQQLVNHVADMQLLHFFRMKSALTEDYREATIVNIEGWVQTADGRLSPVEDSLEMFEGITKRFVHLIRSLDESQWNTRYYHPIRKMHFDQKNAVAMTAWHVRHHLEHIRLALA